MTTTISKETLRRIVRDIKDLQQHPLTTHGIHYFHDDTDVLKGRALIIGPAGTPYENGFYLFTFKFPVNYPHAPPSVNFCTNDGITRFNPNLYRSGKVCLSILNTWQGEPWSGCQTLSSVLLAICTVFNDAPLLNEPGVHKNHPDYATYNKIIAYKNMQFSILELLLHPPPFVSAEFAMFEPTMRDHFRLKLPELQAKIEEKAQAQTQAEPEHLTTVLYGLSVYADYKYLLEKIIILKMKLELMAKEVIRI
jgi:ubiquitin-protein ligase